ncbi:hypothetical protein ACS0TY_024718 [Phlomoides rotata]
MGETPLPGEVASWVGGASGARCQARWIRARWGARLGGSPGEVGEMPLPGEVALWVGEVPSARCRALTCRTRWIRVARPFSDLPLDEMRLAKVRRGARCGPLLCGDWMTPIDLGLPTEDRLPLPMTFNLANCIPSLKKTNLSVEFFSALDQAWDSPTEDRTFAFLITHENLEASNLLLPANSHSWRLAVLLRLITSISY